MTYHFRCKSTKASVRIFKIYTGPCTASGPKCCCVPLRAAQFLEHFIQFYPDNLQTFSLQAILHYIISPLLIVNKSIFCCYDCHHSLRHWFNQPLQQFLIYFYPCFMYHPTVLFNGSNIGWATQCKLHKSFVKAMLEAGPAIFEWVEVQQLRRPGHYRNSMFS